MMNLPRSHLPQPLSAQPEIHFASFNTQSWLLQGAESAHHSFREVFPKKKNTMHLISLETPFLEGAGEAH